MTPKLRPAMTPAQKQKAYRDRQRENAKQNGNVTNEEINQALKESLERIGFYQMSREQKSQLVACTILNIMPELANTDLMTALFTQAMAGEK